VIVADSSVWIASLREQRSAAVRQLEELSDGTDSVLVGDLILLEILQGALSEDHAAALAHEFTSYGIVAMADEAVALAAGRNYRQLRSRGITLRNTVDLIIATFCIERGHVLLHQDRDFDWCERYLGLQVLI
jgi:predicted nucleic acid-binding protein